MKTQPPYPIPQLASLAGINARAVRPRFNTGRDGFRTARGPPTHVGELVEPGEEVVEDAHQLLGLARRRER